MTACSGTGAHKAEKALFGLISRPILYICFLKPMYHRKEVEGNPDIVRSLR
jgi:hypothetical protein